MNDTLERKETVDHFNSFDMKNGKFIGTANGEEYEVKEIWWDGTENKTWVTYYQDGEEVKILQVDGRRYKNTRIYGKEI